MANKAPDNKIKIAQIFFTEGQQQNNIATKVRFSKQTVSRWEAEGEWMQDDLDTLMGFEQMLAFEKETASHDDAPDADDIYYNDNHVYKTLRLVLVGALIFKIYGKSVYS